jgi:hypothetical protein
MNRRMARVALESRPTIAESVAIVSRPLGVAACLFALGVLLGAAVHAPVPGARQGVESAFGFDNPTWLTFAETNLVVLATIVSGAVLFGFPTFVAVVFNGVLVGLIVADAHAQGHGLVAGVSLLLPHGVLEIPALLLGAGVGLAVPRGLVSYLRGHRERILRRRELLAYLQLVGLSVLLIVVAGWIEANLTKQLYELWQAS